MIVRLLNRFEPAPDELLRQISKHVSDEVLQEISIADYGEEADDHLIALRQIRDTGTFPDKMYWVPAEVLELIRWSEPEDASWKPGRPGELGHWMRAFSCAALLRATREPWNYGDGIATGDTLVQLILSLCALPEDFTTQAVRFLAWLILHSSLELTDTVGRYGSDEVSAYGVGLFWFAVKHSPPFADESLILLAEWVTQRADALYKNSENHGLAEMVARCQKRSSWKTLAFKFHDLDMSSRSPDLGVWVQMIGEQMLG